MCVRCLRHIFVFSLYCGRRCKGRKEREEWRGSRIDDLKARLRSSGAQVKKKTLCYFAGKYTAGFYPPPPQPLFSFPCCSAPLSEDVWTVEEQRGSSGAGSQGLTPGWLMGDRDKGLIRAALPIWMSCQRIAHGKYTERATCMQRSLLQRENTLAPNVLLTFNFPCDLALSLTLPASDCALMAAAV